MIEEWMANETNTHQDHVIAHVIGATVVGYFILDETLHVLLDIGFVWTMFVDGEMGLLPHPVATAELAVNDQTRSEIRADIDEGADIVMVKPALPYLDVIRRAKDETRFPLAAFNVSGEYAMVKAASGNGWIDERKAALEVLTSIRRAGADLVLTYHAKDAAEWLAEG